ncbi:polysaccharide deacetylase family protein [Natrarchaeobius chitinivorans]|uniref:Polysaccharide deacetylase n=1 Tax=Natrarchaeobius chitinivorans TaxID=1679083 RepID=A0A3N6LXB3_NATCH|nr:polysaccharide deacetylase [Natrarchaeobius chitinivorans]RQG95393.1 polysaccharide deacetylase [Natrarchaeobius chitinivorans]
MDQPLSRRRMVATLGVTTALAGCLDPRSTGRANESGPGVDSTDGEAVETGERSSDPVSDDSWPAIEAGEVVSDFESANEWQAVVGDIETVTDEVPTGTQAIAVDGDEDRAAMRIDFPRGLDLEGWDVSMAIEAKSVDRIHLEFMAPERGDHLTSIRDVPDEYEGWLRLDFGYIQKHGDPDLTDVRRLNVVAVGPENGPTRFAADDLRRTEAADNGKAILALYGGFRSHYDLAADRLEERGWAATAAVDPDRIGGSGRMNADELRRLRDRGWDVCSYPTGDQPLTQMPDDRRRQILERKRDDLAELGFDAGSRHCFVPDDRMDQATQTVVRDLYESAFLFGASPTGVPPTGIHLSPLIWGPDLHGGVRRAINLCDQYDQLVALRIPKVVADDADGDANSMSLSDFEHLLDHLEHRGLDVVTPSDVIDGTMGGDGTTGEPTQQLQGTILDGGRHHTIDGRGSAESSTFDLLEGIATFEVAGDGDPVLGVELVAVDDSDRRMLPAAGSDTGSSESIVPVVGGTYRLVVEADGEWTVVVDQPAVHADDLATLPVDASGSGSSFVGPFLTEGDVTLEATHDGEGQFVVDGIGADGHREQLINQSGPFDSNRSYSAGGAAWITVHADGNWTVEITG